MTYTTTSESSIFILSYQAPNSILKRAHKDIMYIYFPNLEILNKGILNKKINFKGYLESFNA